MDRRRHKTKKQRATPRWSSRIAFGLVAALSLAVRGEPSPQRPDLSKAEPIATTNLQPTESNNSTPNMQAAAAIYATQPAVDDGLDNYLRSARGEWQIPSEMDRTDPWSRLLLVLPKRPVVIDVAVFIDGRPYRDLRESWIDEVLQSGKSPGADEKPVAAPAENLGTSPVAEASNDSSPKPAPVEADKAAEGKKDEPAVPAIPTVAVQSRQAPAIRDRLVNYLRTIGQSVTRDEIRWLLAEWGSGPPLVVLGPGLSWQRATSAPLLAYLDQNADGELNVSEISGMTERLKRADLDANDIVEVNEMRRVDARPLATRYSIGHPILIALDDATNWQALASDLKRIYGQNRPANMADEKSNSASTMELKERIQKGDPGVDARELRKLVDEPADVSIRVDFGTKDDASKRVSILSLGPGLGPVKDALTVSDDVITLDLGVDYIEISAFGGASTDLETSGSQIAIGAVVDGDPLLRSIDRDLDGRLTSRERDVLGAQVRGLDKNGDGQASADEIPLPIRLAITQGPQVHERLKTARPAARMPAAPTKIAAPDWFASADLNNDGDWSPNEFIGTPEEFRKFDLDGDGRMSVAEAIAAAGGQ